MNKIIDPRDECSYSTTDETAEIHKLNGHPRHHWRPHTAAAAATAMGAIVTYVNTDIVFFVGSGIS